MDQPGASHVDGRPLRAAPDPPPAAAGGQDGPAEAPCRFCESVWGVAGLLIAAALAFVAIDLLTGGRLTGSQMISAVMGSEGGPGE